MAYYEQSGKINAPFTLISAVVGAGLIGLLAYGYSFLTDFNPFIYLNFLATAGYVLVVVFILGSIQRMGKVRSFSAAIVLAIALSAFGLFAVWTSYIAVVFERGIDFALSNFGDSLETLSHRSYSIGRRSSSIDLSGGVLMACWIVEAAILFGGPVFFIISAGKNDSIYCEDCDNWAGFHKSYYRKSFNKLTQPLVEEKIRMRKIADLLALDVAHPDLEGVGEYYEIKFSSCESCKKRVYLSVKRFDKKRTKKDEVETNEEMILPFYELDMHDIPREVLNPVVEAT